MSYIIQQMGYKNTQTYQRVVIFVLRQILLTNLQRNV